MNLLEARFKKKMTQWALRKKTGINQSKISLIENNYVTPTPYERAVIAKALGFSTDEIQWPEETPHRCQDAAH